MNWIDVLEKLHFSLWQLIIIFAVVYFRREIKELTSRTKSLKIGDKEIQLSERADFIAELMKIRKAISHDIEKGDPSRAISRIDEVMKHKLTGALISLKQNTKYLWPSLSAPDRTDSFQTEVQAITYNRIYEDLLMLRSAGLLDFMDEKTFQYAEGGAVREIQIFNISKEIDDLIDLANRY